MRPARPIRLLLAAHGFPPRQAAGAEWRAHRTALAAKAAGHDVLVLAADPRLVPEDEGRAGALERDVVDGVDVLRIPVPVRPGWGWRSEFDNRDVHAVVQDQLRRTRPDVVHLISGYALSGSVLAAAATEGIPAVVTLTDFWFLCPRITLRRRTGERCDVPELPEGCVACLANELRRYRWAHRATAGRSSQLLERAWRHPRLRAGRIQGLHGTIVARRAFLGRMLSTAARVIAPSQFVAALFRRHGIRVEQLVHMRQGLDIASWRPVGVVPSASAPGGLRVGFIGQLTEEKGVFDLMEAVGALRSDLDVRLALHGDAGRESAATSARLKAAVRRDRRIALLGPFDNRDIRRVHAGLDVLVVPSRWYENSPNVILEAFACGTPVIAIDLGGMAELVTHEVDGLLVPPGDVAALAAALRRAATEPGLLDRLRAGIRPVKTIDEEMAELVELYDAVIAESAGRAA